MAATNRNTSAGSTSTDATTDTSSTGAHRVEDDTTTTDRVDMARDTSTGPTEHREHSEHVEHVTQVQPPVAQQRTSASYRDTDPDNGTTRPAYDTRTRDDSEARDRFGGINWGAGFFGWLVAIGMTIILSGIVGAVVTAVGNNLNLTVADAKASAGSIGIGAGITLLVVLMLAYFTGGYVAGRMSRFDGARQGVATWVIGLLVTLLVAAVGAIAGDQYNVFSRISLPRLPLNMSELGTGGAITALAVLVGTLLAAIVGGKVGHRYHTKVDRAAGFTR